MARPRRAPFAAAAPELATLRDWLRFAVDRFAAARLAFGHGTSSAQDEAAYLLLHSLGLPLERLEPHLDRRLTPAERARVAKLLDRRLLERIPAAYLVREAWLGEHRFYVDERVIVPRSHIAELLRASLAPWIARPTAVRHALDLCTGSGCLAILAALAFRSAHLDASDVSADALAVARRNLAAYRLRRRVRLVRSDLFARLAGERYDLILCNPPYVPAAAMRALPREYRHEPRAALAGGRDGLAFVRQLLAAAPAHLNADGLLVVEVGDGRSALERAFPRLPFTWLATSAGDAFVFLLRASEIAAAARGSRSLAGTARR